MLTADPRVVDHPARRAAAVVRRSLRAGLLRRQGAASEHDSSRPSAKDIPVRILNSRRAERQRHHASPPSPPSGGRPLAALACKRRVTVVEITSTRMLMAHGFLRRLFEVFERFRTAVDVVTTSEVSVSVTVDDDRQPAADRRRRSSSSPRCASSATWRSSARSATTCATIRGLRSRVIGALEGVPRPDGVAGGVAPQRDRRAERCDLAAAMGRLHQAFFQRQPECRAS